MADDPAVSAAPAGQLRSDPSTAFVRGTLGRRASCGIVALPPQGKSSNDGSPTSSSPLAKANSFRKPNLEACMGGESSMASPCASKPQRVARISSPALLLPPDASASPQARINDVLRSSSKAALGGVTGPRPPSQLTQRLRRGSRMLSSLESAEELMRCASDAVSNQHAALHATHACNSQALSSLAGNRLRMELSLVWSSF
jgi:hypothetical protein